MPVVFTFLQEEKCPTHSKRDLLSQICSLLNQVIPIEFRKGSLEDRLMALHYYSELRPFDTEGHQDYDSLDLLYFMFNWVKRRPQQNVKDTQGLGTLKVCGKKAYVAQSPWIQSGKIEDNILFGKKMDKEKYEKECLLGHLSLKTVNDKCKIKKVIKELDEKKETLNVTWVKVTKNK
ncbi:hypothetical protein Ahy_A09g043455 [Arachis hypogaea]|uniref:Uncharacterized protein n=1 Tax=Arachis hypogaea TaxID=3818 RepID=A0A445BIC3_ARAHY|nr:hypothetical protein Ahy_A09g043455 [Arachis hypogaea]